MAIKHHLKLDPTDTRPPTRDHPQGKPVSESLPASKQAKLHPSKAGGENARIFFIGTATTIIEWEGIRLLTDPNFLHAGDHVHLGPGVTATRETNPAVDLHDVPRVDLICLSHYHEDHFDREVEASLRRDLPIITTPHAKVQLDDYKSPEERFSAVTDLDTFESALVEIKKDGGPLAENGRRPAIKVTAMPGKHVPPGFIEALNDFLRAVPPVNGWIIELGSVPSSSSSSKAEESDFECGYRIYQSGDTLLIDDLKQIPERYQGDKAIDLMLVHLGGTTIPSKKLPLMMVTMDSKQGVELIRLVQPDLTIPIHFDDYDMFLSPLSDFQKAVDEAGLSEKVVYLDRGEDYHFRVRNS